MNYQLFYNISVNCCMFIGSGHWSMEVFTVKIKSISLTMFSYHCKKRIDRIFFMLCSFTAVCKNFEPPPPPPTNIYRKISIISPGLIFVQMTFLLGLFSGELIFRGAYYWKEFCVSKWVGLDNKNSYH